MTFNLMFCNKNGDEYIKENVKDEDIAKIVAKEKLKGSVFTSINPYISKSPRLIAR